MLYNIQDVLSQLKTAPPDIKKKAADLVAQAQNVAPPSDQPTPGLGIADILTQIQQGQPDTPPQVPGPGLPQPDSTQLNNSYTPNPVASPATPSPTTLDPSALNPTPNAPPIIAPSIKGTANGNVLGTPSIDERANQAQDAYLAALGERPQHSKWWKNAGIIAAQIASNVANPSNQVPIQTWGEQKKQSHVQNALDDLRPILDLQKVNQDREYKLAQTGYMNSRPGIAKAAEADKEKRTGYLGANVQRKQDDDFRKNNPIFDAASPTDGQIAQLKAIGRTPEDFGSYDLSKTPPLRKFGKQVFEYSAKDHAWNLTDIDPTSNDPLVPYTITTPEGTTETLQIPSSKKASLLTQLKAAGMQIQGKKEISDNTLKQRHDEFMMKFNNQVQEQQKAGTYKRDTFIVGLDAALKAHQVTKEDYDVIVAALPQ